jgi:hypothetical protein
MSRCRWRRIAWQETLEKAGKQIFFMQRPSLRRRLSLMKFWRFPLKRGLRLYADSVLEAST